MVDKMVRSIVNVRPEINVFLRRFSGALSWGWNGMDITVVAMHHGQSPNMDKSMPRGVCGQSVVVLYAVLAEATRRRHIRLHSTRLHSTPVCMRCTTYRTLRPGSQRTSASLVEMITDG